MKRGIITISESGTVSIPTTPIWMTQFEIADMFGVFAHDIRKVIHTIYKNKELSEEDTRQHIKQSENISYDAYSLELIIAVSFRVNSRESAYFRRFVENRLREKNVQPSLWLSFGKRDTPSDYILN